MELVSIEDVEPTAIGEQSTRQQLTEPLGTTGVAINCYRLGPGEGFPGGLHAHADQEEVFVVLDGEAIFETMDGEVTVGDREAIRFAPGEFQSGRAGEIDTRVLALGAPRDTEDVRIPAGCPACAHDHLRLATDETVTFECTHCGAEHVPADCPACGHVNLEFEIDGRGDPVVVCQGCTRTYDRPPLRE